MKRRIIKQGHNTLTVTLPSKWVKKMGIEQGDEIEVSEQEKMLLISAERGPSLSRIVVDVTGLSAPLIWRFVSSAYRAGYDEIRVEGLRDGDKKVYSAFSYNTLDYLKSQEIISMSPIEVVQALTNRLVGVEIIDQKDSYCTIKELGETSDKEFENALRRLFFLLKNEADTLLQAFGGSTEGLKSIHIIDTNLDRFEDFCIRVLNKKGYSNYRKTPVIYTTIFLLEMIGDEFKRLAIHLLEGLEPKSKIIQNLVNSQAEQLERCHNLFYKFSKEKATEIFDIDKQLTEMTISNQNQLEKDDLELLHHLKKIGIYILSLTELRIDMEF